MKASFWKRIGAYFIDCLIITLVCSICVRYLPNYKKIEKLNNDSSSILTEYSEVLSSGDSEKMAEYNEKINDFNYDLKKASVFSSMLSITLYSLYFIVFQRYNNGQTVGKKLLKLEVASNDGEALTMKQTLIRSLILYPIVFELIDLCIIFMLSKSLYLSVSSWLSLLQGAVFIACCITAIFGRGLHDRLANTNVIVFGTVAEEEESSVSKWKKTSSLEKEVKTYRVNHTSKKKGS